MAARREAGALEGNWMRKRREARGNGGRGNHHGKERLPDTVRARVIATVKATDTLTRRGKARPGKMPKEVQGVKDHRETHLSGAEVNTDLAFS